VIPLGTLPLHQRGATPPVEAGLEEVERNLKGLTERIP